MNLNKYYSKQKQYKLLFSEFKNNKFSDPDLLNPFKIANFNYNVLNPWELWHGNLDAEIMLIGQDFSNQTYFSENFDNNWLKEQRSQTNNRLRKLFSYLGYDIGLPGQTYNSEIRYLPLFFTNAVLGIKSGTMNRRIEDKWWKESSYYLNQLINIIHPKHIICMGEIAYKTICYINNIERKDFSKMVKKNGENNISKSNLFVVYHVSNTRSRSLKSQTEDWENLSKFL